MYRRYSNRKISKIKNINIIQSKLKQALITKKDVLQQITLKVYQIGINNSYTGKIIFSGNILDTLDFCTQWQINMIAAFDGYLNNIRHNSDRKSMIAFSNQLLNKIIQSNLYDNQCFSMLRSFIKDFSNSNPQQKLPNSKMKDYIDGQNGIKDQISLYRKIVTKDRVNILKALQDYYISNNQKQTYSLGVSKIQKAIDNDQVLIIQLKESGQIRIKPQSVQQEKWILFGQQLDQNDNVIKKVVICQSDVKK